MPKLIIVRGLPGSGKSTIAGELVKAGYTHIEADMFHTHSESGAYDFQLERRDEARAQWSERRPMRRIRYERPHAEVQTVL